MAVSVDMKPTKTSTGPRRVVVVCVVGHSRGSVTHFTPLRIHITQYISHVFTTNNNTVTNALKFQFPPPPANVLPSLKTKIPIAIYLFFTAPLFSSISFSDPCLSQGALLLAILMCLLKGGLLVMHNH